MRAFIIKFEFTSLLCSGVRIPSLGKKNKCKLISSIQCSKNEKIVQLFLKKISSLLFEKLNENIKIGGLESAKAVAAFEILKSSLNFETGGEIAKNLEQIYNYSLNQLHLIIKDDKEYELDTVISIINSLVDAWSSMSVNN